MAVHTLSLAGIHSAPPAAPTQVPGARHWLKMTRVDTRPVGAGNPARALLRVVAEVIEFQPLRDRTDQPFVSESVSLSNVVVAEVESSIPPGSGASRPHPTSVRLVDLRPEPFLQGWRVSQRVTPQLPPLVVHRTPRPSAGLFGTSVDGTLSLGHSSSVDEKCVRRG